MKKYSFLILLIWISCTTSTEKFDLDFLENEISGEYLNDSIQVDKKTLSSDLSKAEIYYKSNNSILNEIDIHIETKHDSVYQILTNYYNLKFKTTHTDSTFNSWKTDSSEFLLYKNSDSSILVNIFKRTYL